MAAILSDMSPGGACGGEEPTGAGCSTPLREKQLAKGRDNAVTQQLLKTKMCTFFEKGKCASNTCRYAHSPEELRSAPNLHKTKLCKLFMQGACNDENCPFAHGDQDIRVTEGIYKTQMCNFFERGYCKKGDRCNHAHGLSDLRASTPAKPKARDLARTPLSAMSRGSDGSTPLQQRGTPGYPQQLWRSPLPLAELLAGDAEGGAVAGSAAPTPSKVRVKAAAEHQGGGRPGDAAAEWERGSSTFHLYDTLRQSPGGQARTPSVAELASLTFSPAAASPMWHHQMPGMPLSAGGSLAGAVSPLAARHSALGGGMPPLGATLGDPRPVWGALDPVSMLVAPEQRQAAWTSSPDAEAKTPTRTHASQQPLRVELAEPFSSTPPARPARGARPGLRSAQPLRADSPEAVEDLSERLASLDCLVKGFSADVAELTGRQPRGDGAVSTDRQRHVAV